MNVLKKVQAIDPDANFRHPELGLNRCEDDATEWGRVVWINGNEDGNGDPVKPTYAELVAADYPAAYQQQVALESLYAPFTYNGDLYGMTPDRTQQYDALMNKHGRGGAAKTVVLKLDGSPVKFGNRAALKAFLDAIDAEIETRLAAAYDAL